jgi:hypothetical protein
MKIRFQADADLNQDIVAAVIRREPTISFQTANEAVLEGLSDPEVLAIAAREEMLDPLTLSILKLPLLSTHWDEVKDILSLQDSSGLSQPDSLLLITDNSADCFLPGVVFLLVAEST